MKNSVHRCMHDDARPYRYPQQNTNQCSMRSAQRTSVNASGVRGVSGAFLKVMLRSRRAGAEKRACGCCARGAAPTSRTTTTILCFSRRAAQCVYKTHVAAVRRTRSVSPWFSRKVAMLRQRRRYNPNDILRLWVKRRPRSCVPRKLHSAARFGNIDENTAHQCTRIAHVDMQC